AAFPGIAAALSPAARLSFRQPVKMLNPNINKIMERLAPRTTSCMFPLFFYPRTCGNGSGEISGFHYGPLKVKPVANLPVDLARIVVVKATKGQAVIQQSPRVG